MGAVNTAVLLLDIVGFHVFRQIQVVGYLLNLAADVHACDAEGHLPIHVAAESGNVEALLSFVVAFGDSMGVDS
eukprot:s1257_g4.t1